MDTRIVYGVLCVWWDDISKVGNIGGLPCCPHCKGVLFEQEDPARWWKGVDSYENDGHPGYRDFVKWLRGRCFPNYQIARDNYEREKGGGTITP